MTPRPSAEELVITALEIIHTPKVDGSSVCADDGQPWPCHTRLVLDQIEPWRQEIAEETSR